MYVYAAARERKNEERGEEGRSDVLDEGLSLSEWNLRFFFSSPSPSSSSSSSCSTSLSSLKYSRPQKRGEFQRIPCSRPRPAAERRRLRFRTSLSIMGFHRVLRAAERMARRAHMRMVPMYRSSSMEGEK